MVRAKLGYLRYFGTESESPNHALLGQIINIQQVWRVLCSDLVKRYFFAGLRMTIVWLFALLFPVTYFLNYLSNKYPSLHSCSILTIKLASHLGYGIIDDKALYPLWYTMVFKDCPNKKNVIGCRPPFP